MDKITFDTTSDIEKDIPGESTTQIYTKKPIDTAIDMEDVKLVSTADLYHNILYSVVPKDFDIAADIIPEVQGFHKRYVYLWDDYSSLFKFKPDIWKNVQVKVPPDILGRQLFKSVGDVYILDSVPANWVTEALVPPRYVE